MIRTNPCKIAKKLKSDKIKKKKNKPLKKITKS